MYLTCSMFSFDEQWLNQLIINFIILIDQLLEIMNIKDDGKIMELMLQHIKYPNKINIVIEGR